MNIEPYRSTAQPCQYSISKQGENRPSQPYRQGRFTPNCMLRINDVKTRTGLSRSTIYSKLDPKSSAYDPTFPKQIKLGVRAVAWLEEEIDTWLQQQVMMRH
nr:AlpA family phage regulatory protein [Halomonas sp. UBA3074]